MRDLTNTHEIFLAIPLVSSRFSTVFTREGKRIPPFVYAAIIVCALSERSQTQIGTLAGAGWNPQRPHFTPLRPAKLDYVRAPLDYARTPLVYAPSPLAELYCCRSAC